MRDKLLIGLADWHANHPWRMLGVSILITVICLGFASQLDITMRMTDLLPEKDPRVAQFNEIIDEFNTATSLVIVAQGEEKRIKEFADVLAPQILELIDNTQNETFQEQIVELQDRVDQLKAKGKNNKKIADLESEIEYLKGRINMQIFQRVDYKVETDFLRNHALMLIKEDNLENMKDLFTDPNLTGLLTNINNSMEKEYVGKEESISTREKEDGAIGFLDGIENLTLQLQKAADGAELSKSEIEETADKFLLGEPYFLSYDKTALILNAIPNFTIMDRDLLEIGVTSVTELIDKTLKDYPDVKVGLSGDIARERDEQTYATQTIGYSTIFALIAILILLIISFKMLIAPIFAIFNLVLGVIWAFGAAGILVGRLNMMTVMMSVVILGLGIDFSIHLISGFTEWRAKGDSIAEAMKKKFLKSGKGIVTGALTTACAFLALLVSRSRGMSEMGMVMGGGLIAILLATMLFLPILLVFREQRIDRRREKLEAKGIKKFVKRDISFRSLGQLGEKFGHNYVLTIIFSIVVTGLLVWSAVTIEYDQNFMNMEPKGLTSIALMDTIKDKFDLNMQYSLCLASSIEECRELSEKYQDLSLVAFTGDITSYLPLKEEQLARKPHLIEIGNTMRNTSIQHTIPSDALPNLITEIERLEMNIIEMQDMAFLGGQDKVDNKCMRIVGDPEDPDSHNIIQELRETLSSKSLAILSGLSNFQKYFAPYFRETVIKMASLEAIKFEELPESILDQFCNRTRDKFMITIYPAGNLYEDTQILNRFVEDIERISPRTTGAGPVAVAMLKIFARDGRNAILLTIAIIFILLMIDFRKIEYALIAMIPLALGVFWMIGIQHLIGLKFNFMNFIGLPLIIGIGIDDGVHIMHRWIHEGRDKIHIIFASTGKAILLTSLTTMLAFGSMMFSAMPAYSWFGTQLFIGVGACFVTTVLVLPGILGMIDKRKDMKIREKNNA